MLFADAREFGTLNPAVRREIDMKYEVREHPILPGSWEVSAEGPDGEVYLTLFGGTDAQKLAEEYAGWKSEAQ
jgi:hypothetical protein